MNGVLDKRLYNYNTNGFQFFLNLISLAREIYLG